MSQKKLSLLGLTHDQFSQSIATALGKGKIHAQIIYEEFFRKGEIKGEDPAFWNAQRLYHDILECCDLSMPELLDKRTDGQTGKVLLKTSDQLEVESVLIPMKAGNTLCISSQVGCRMGCAFCETGRMGLLRNLTAAEIVSQVFLTRFALGFSIRNIVFMGMGEPFDNYEAVMQAAQVLMDSKGLGFGRNHITISTSGCVDAIYRFTDEEFAPNLAVSLNGSFNEQRKKLMPVTRKFDMTALYQAILNYNQKTNREVLVAYVMLKGVNDSLEDAERLATYLKGLNVKVNIIPYNHQSCDRFQSSTAEQIQAFVQIIRENGFYTLLRDTKGDKIMAACGQLGNIQLAKQIKSQK